MRYYRHIRIFRSIGFFHAAQREMWLARAAVRRRYQFTPPQR